MSWTKLERSVDIIGEGFLVVGFMEDVFLGGPDGLWEKLAKITDQ